LAKTYCQIKTMDIFLCPNLKSTITLTLTIHETLPSPTPKNKPQISPISPL